MANSNYTLKKPLELYDGQRHIRTVAESAGKYIDMDKYSKAYGNMMNNIKTFNSSVLPAIQSLEDYAGKQNYYVNGDTYDTHIQDYIDTCFTPFTNEVRYQTEQMLLGAVENYNKKQEQLNTYAQEQHKRKIFEYDMSKAYGERNV